MKMEQDRQVAVCALVALAIILPSAQAAIGQRSSVPTRIANQLKEVRSTQEFLRRFVVNREGPTAGNWFDLETGSISAMGIEVIAASAADMSQGCVPRTTAVEFSTDANPNVIMWPTCVEVQRCGGCCLRDDEECVPTQMNQRIEPVVRAVYTHPGSINFEFDGIQDIPVDEHLACECRCKVQAHHCDPIKQSYDRENCLCRCFNENEAPYCPSHKRWDPMQCACVCPQISYCEDEKLFNFQTCRCEDAVQQQVDTATPNPCPGLRCRHGYEAMYINQRCACRVSSQWGDRSLGRK